MTGKELGSGDSKRELEEGCHHSAHHPGTPGMWENEQPMRDSFMEGPSAKTRRPGEGLNLNLKKG